MPIIFGAIPGIMAEFSSSMPIIALNISIIIVNWQNTIHPLICFIYVRALRTALSQILKSMASVVNINWKKIAATKVFILDN